MVCTKVKGEPIYEIVKPIPMHQEIIVYFLPERPEELFFSRMRNTFYRQTMDSILDGERIYFFDELFFSINFLVVFAWLWEKICERTEHI